MAVGTKHSRVKGIEVCLKEGLRTFEKNVIKNSGNTLMKFKNRLQNHWANINQTWHKASFGKGNSSLKMKDLSKVDIITKKRINIDKIIGKISITNGLTSNRCISWWKKFKCMKMKCHVHYLSRDNNKIWLKDISRTIWPMLTKHDTMQP